MKPEMSTVLALMAAVLVTGTSAASPARFTGWASCGICDVSSCAPPSGCLAGMVKDSCNCCYTCGKREGELCDINPRPNKRGYGRCGDNLECRFRTDLAPGDPPEPLCFCKRTDRLCGSDGRTYDNECQLTEARYKLRNGLRAVSRGPCKFVPSIVSSPEDLYNMTGSYVALTCEAMGWPVPVIEWKVDRTENGELYPLPNDDPHIIVLTRGGPIQYEVTSWLQLIKLVPEDDGRYWCIARNEVGEASTSAYIHIIDNPRRH